MSNQNNNFYIHNKNKYRLNSIDTLIKKPIKFGASLHSLKSAVPAAPTVDLRPWLQPVRDQGQIGDCVAFATAVIAEYQAKKTNVFSGYLSPWFLFSLAGPNCNTGISPPGALEVLQNYGIPNESNLPTPMSCPDKLPDLSSCVYANAKNFRISSYMSINSADDMKEALTNYGPCVIGVYLYDNNNPSQMWVPSGPGDKPSGAHALTVVGYDNDSFIVRNSWGPGWGNGGYSNLYFKDYGCIQQAFSAIALNGETVYTGTLINNTSIVAITIIGLFIAYLIYYAYTKRLYNLSFSNLSYNYGRYISEILFFLMLILTIIIMASINGMNNVFIINLAVLGCYLLSMLINLYIRNYMRTI